MSNSLQNLSNYITKYFPASLSNQILRYITKNVVSISIYTTTLELNSSQQIKSKVIKNLVYEGLTHVETRLFFYPLFKNGINFSFSQEFLDDNSLISGFEDLLKLSSLIPNNTENEILAKFDKFIESLYFKLQLPKLNNGVNDEGQVQLQLPLIYFPEFDTDGNGYLSDVYFFLKLVSSDGSQAFKNNSNILNVLTNSLKLNNINILKPVSKVQLVKIGNDGQYVNYGLCGLSSFSWKIETFFTSINNPQNISNITQKDVTFNPLVVTVNVTFEKIFPGVPVIQNKTIQSMNRQESTSQDTDFIPSKITI